MLIKHSIKMPSKLALVNKTLIGLLIAGSTVALPTAANAAGYNSAPIKQVEHKVKFKVSDLKTQEGLAAVYAMLEKKAAKACAFGRHVDKDGNLISKEDCTADMTAQFISSANLESLSQYHLMKGAALKSASLLPR